MGMHCQNLVSYHPKSSLFPDISTREVDQEVLLNPVELNGLWEWVRARERDHLESVLRMMRSKEGPHSGRERKREREGERGYKKRNAMPVLGRGRNCTADWRLGSGWGGAERQHEKWDCHGKTQAPRWQKKSPLQKVYFTTQEEVFQDLDVKSIYA